MIITNLVIKNFRNHPYKNYSFKRGLNIFTGPNGSGKTNVIEAVHFLSLARSFRTQEEEELILNGKDEAEIYAVIEEGEISRKIRIQITKRGKRVFINGKPASKISELSNVVNVLLFEPKDVLLFRGSPKNRRSFIDINLSKKSQRYLELISRYEKVLKQRNELLKQDQVDETLLDTVTEMLIDLAIPICQEREAYIKDINDILIIITRALTGDAYETGIKYLPFVPIDENIRESMREAFKKALETDLRRKATSIGPHHEDFVVSINGRDIGEYGSQGENRMVAIALKLSPYFLVDDKDKHPIIVLDDVMSELDQNHRLRLIKLLSRFDQVFITATRLDVKGTNQYKFKKR